MFAPELPRAPRGRKRFLTHETAVRIGTARARWSGVRHNVEKVTPRYPQGPSWEVKPVDYLPAGQ